MHDTDTERRLRVADALGRPHSLPPVTLTAREPVMGDFTIPVAAPTAPANPAEQFTGGIADVIEAALADPETRREVVAYVNEQVNIPIIGEGVEGRLLDGAYGLIAEGIVRAIRSRLGGR